MFQPLEVTEARTLWIDSPSTERLGFQDSSRVQIDRDPIGTGDFTETGDGFKAKLLGGMWPDDDELRLLVVGVVPGSEQEYDYLRSISDHLVGKDDAKAMNKLRSLVQIMPAWAGQQERTIFVSSTLPRIKPETVKSASQRGSTAAVNSEPQPKMSFDMWRIQVDMKLIASGRGGTEGLTDKGLTALRKDYNSGVSPSDYAHAYISVDI